MSSTFETWAQDKLSVFLGFNESTIKTQVWPYVMSTKTPESMGERLMDMVGLTDESLKFIEEFTQRRFYPEKIPSPPAPTQDPAQDSFPDLPSFSNQEIMWPANISVHNKKEEEYISSLKKMRKKPKPSSSTQDLRSAALLIDKPKPKKKKEMSLDTALKELGIGTQKAKACSCQASRHPLLTIAPNCLNCGKIICAAEGIGPCGFCKSPIISEEQEKVLIAEAKQKRIEKKQENLVVDKILEKKRMEKTKVMTIDSRSKQIRVKNIESSASEEEEEEEEKEPQHQIQLAPKRINGTYAYNPLLKGAKGPKFIRKKIKKQQQQQ